MTTIDRLLALRRAATEARNCYVGRHWPSMAAARRDGIGFGLVEDRAHERFIRRFVATFSPDFMVDLLDEMRLLGDVAVAAREYRTNQTIAARDALDAALDRLEAAP